MIWGQILSYLISTSVDYLEIKFYKVIDFSISTKIGSFKTHSTKACQTRATTSKESLAYRDTNDVQIKIEFLLLVIAKDFHVL